MRDLFIPVNIEIANNIVKLMTPRKVWASVGVLLLSILATVFLVFKRLFFDAETRNIVGGIVLLFVIFYITQLVILKIILKEKLLMKYYKNIQKLKNVSTFEFTNIYSIDNSLGVPVYLCSNGMRLMGIKLYYDSIIGKTSEEEIEDHYNAVKKLIGKLANNFKFVWRLSLTNSYGYDTRWDYLININSNNKSAFLKQIIDEIILYNQKVKSNICCDYYIVAEDTLVRPMSHMLESLTTCAKQAEKAKYSGWDYLDEDVMSEVMSLMFRSDKNINELMKSSKENKATLNLVQITKIFKKDGSTIDYTIKETKNESKNLFSRI